MGLFNNYIKLAKAAYTKTDVSPEVEEVLEQNSFDEGFGIYGGGNSQMNKDLAAIHSSEWLAMFNSSPRLSTVYKIATDNGVAEFKIVAEDEDNHYKQVKGHPLEEEIKSLTVPMFFSLWTVYRLMTGIVYIAYDYDDKTKRPVNFKIYTNIHLLEKPNMGDRDSKWKFRVGSSEYTYERNRVIVDLDIDPVNPYTNGYGRAGAIMSEIQADRYASLYTGIYYENSARPEAFIMPKPLKEGSSLNNSEIRRLTTQLRDYHKGWQNSHKMAVIGFPADIETIPTNHQEMELLSTRKYYRDVGHQHFNVPPEIVGIVENSNKATVIAAEHIYAKQVRMPLLGHFEDIINSKILPLYEVHEGIEFKFENILPDDLELDIKVAKEGREAASLTINEHRSLLGKPKFTNDYGNMPVGTAYTPEMGALEVEKPYEYLTYSDLRKRLRKIDKEAVIEIIQDEKEES